MSDDFNRKMHDALTKAYTAANSIVEGDQKDDLTTRMGSKLRTQVDELAQTKNAARGVALTLTAYKVANPDQDIRAHKSEHEGGFAARAVDTRVTVPFLIEHTLPRNVETHWLSQTYSFAGPFVLGGKELRTQPKKAGQLLIPVVDAIHNADPALAEAVLIAILRNLIEIRNKDRVILTRPKDLAISEVKRLISAHISSKYKSNAPRLPQLVIYAIYQCLTEASSRYDNSILEPLERLKSADRKKGTIGDIVIAKDGVRMEAVEIKQGQPIRKIHVLEAIDKVRAESVRRYYMLSDEGVDTDEAVEIEKEITNFRRQNGCEVITGGVLESMTSTLRFLSNTTDFLARYAELVETDPDTGYEHRIRWNECCDEL
tara:strand:- start:279 stop:1397 length:1119 start_codon:yes stop_codon:yes gene_type:complete